MDTALLAQNALHQGPGLGVFSENISSPEDASGPASGEARGYSPGKNKGKDDSNDGHCTVMLRNLPNKYTRQMLVDQLHRYNFKGQIDYIYLPTDFANRCNVGYAFVNLRTPEARERFSKIFDGVAAHTCLPGFNSHKVCQVTKAKIQGRGENLRRLRNSPDLMAQLQAHPDWLPALLDEQGEEEPFPFDGLGFAGGGGCGGHVGNVSGDGRMPRGANGQMHGGPKGGRQRRNNSGQPQDGMGGGRSAAPVLFQGWMGFPPDTTPGGGGGRGGRGGGRGKRGKGGLAMDMPGHPPGAPFPGFPVMPLTMMPDAGLPYLPGFEYGGGFPGYYLPYAQMDPSTSWNALAAAAQTRNLNGGGDFGAGGYGMQEYGEYEEDELM